MTYPPDQPNYTIKAAARRVRRSTRTIERWIEGGMRCRNVAGMIVIDHQELLDEWRSRLTGEPRNR